MVTAAQQVASWSRKAREAISARDEWIRTMRAEGASLRAIGELADLSHTAIAKICVNMVDSSL